MNNIQPTYVTFEQAKLLEEKKIYTPFWKENYFRKSNGELMRDMKAETFDSDIHIFAPEQWQVVEWAFKKYQYSIEAEMNIPESGEYNGCYVFNGIIKGSKDYKLKIFYKSKDYPTREKALSEAINEFLKII